ncbi:MAG: hypothetical protein IPM29_09375 [Planctomycetes bacterium]|nr:hypothetical protein [Planctomycetota bacterium]
MAARSFFLALIASAVPLLAQSSWDFEHSFRTVFDQHADDYLVHTANVQKVQENSLISFWTPVATGSQAVVRYRFAFPGDTTAVNLLAKCSVWNYTLGVGEASIWGSIDGQSWALLLDIPTPVGRIDGGGTYDGPLPASLTGAREIWIECRMLRRSGTYPYGGAQFCRMDVSSGLQEIFALRAQYQRPLASYTSYRQSCRSSVGATQLNATLPIAGQVWTLSVTGLKPNTVGYVFFGLRDDYLGLIPLPLELGLIGAPGCYINVNTDPGTQAVDQLLPSNGQGVATAQIGLPTDPAVIGFTFYNQYVSLDAPPGRSLGITTTNAGRGVVGL